MTTSYGGTTFWPSTCGLYSCTLLILATGCILIVLGNSSSIAFVETTLFTLYRPTNHSISFFVLFPFICHFKSFVLSITKFSFWYFSPSLLFLSIYYFISFYAFFSATFASFWILFILSTNSSAALCLLLLLPSNSILGSCLQFALKDETFIAEWILLL